MEMDKCKKRENKDTRHSHHPHLRSRPPRRHGTGYIGTYFVPLEGNLN